MAIYRRDEILLKNINTTKLKTGDALLLAAPEFMEQATTEVLKEEWEKRSWASFPKEEGSR